MKKINEEAKAQSIMMIATALLEKDVNLDIPSAVQQAKEMTDKLEKEILKHFSDDKDYFKDFNWPKDGATRTELDKWITESTGYTSNRKHEEIINNSLANKIIMKRLNTKRYYYNR